jgi:hypothetical protein
MNDYLHVLWQSDVKSVYPRPVIAPNRGKAASTAYLGDDSVGSIYFAWAGPCFEVSFTLCPNRRYFRHNILIVSSDLDTIHIPFHYRFISITELNISSTLGHSTKAVVRECNRCGEKRLSRGSRTSTVDVKTVARHRIRPSPFCPDPVFSCTEAPPLETRLGGHVHE